MITVNNTVKKNYKLFNQKQMLVLNLNNEVHEKKLFNQNLILVLNVNNAVDEKLFNQKLMLMFNYKKRIYDIVRTNNY